MRLNMYNLCIRVATYVYTHIICSYIAEYFILYLPGYFGQEIQHRIHEGQDKKHNNNIIIGSI